MNENWDSFPVNINEMTESIKRNGFKFSYSRFEVWQDGNCIYQDSSKGLIVAEVNNGHLNVKINDIKINRYIIGQFSFSEISTINDRIMWSKDIFNTSGNTEFNNPDISSLFYKNGVLSKVAYTIHNSNTLVEFYP